MSVLSRLVAAGALAVASVAPLPAHAVEACFENNQLTFVPPLTETIGSGSVTVDWQGTCADLPGLVPGQYSGTTTIPYTGSCLLAQIGASPLQRLVGGTLYFFVRGSVEVKVEVMQPDNVCPITTAHGTGVIVTAP